MNCVNQRGPLYICTYHCAGKLVTVVLVVCVDLLGTFGEGNLQRNSNYVFTHFSYTMYAHGLTGCEHVCVGQCTLVVQGITTI